MSVRRRGASLDDIRNRIKTIGVRAAIETAARGADSLTTQALSDFDSGRNAYGDPRPLGTRGPVTLVRTGRLRGLFGFASSGTRLRVVLNTPYAKYMVGRFGILPAGRSAIPARWRDLLQQALRDSGVSA
jgi:hypothetical protein